MLNAFKMADEVLLQGVQGITDLITTPGLINTDFADVKMIMSDAGSALMGIGYGIRRGPGPRRGPGRDLQPAARSLDRGRAGHPAHHRRWRAISACSRSTRPPRSSTAWPTPTPTSSSAPSSTTRWATRCGSPSSLPASIVGRTRRSRSRRAGDVPVTGPLRRRRRGRRRGRRRLRRALVPPVALLHHVGVGPAPVGPPRECASVATGVQQGDLAVRSAASALDGRRRRIVDRPWVWLDQVHGAAVVVVDAHDDVRDLVGAPADAVVTSRTDVALAVHTADCAPVGFLSDNGMIGAAHAGWRGLVEGVLPAAVAAMRRRGAIGVRAVLGPCIGVECYEFGEADLAAVVRALGVEVAGRTTSGALALDMRRGVEVVLEDLGVPIVARDPRCTACGQPSSGSGRGPAHFSHRARADAGRQALAVWSELVVPG